MKIMPDHLRGDFISWDDFSSRDENLSHKVIVLFPFGCFDLQGQQVTTNANLFSLVLFFLFSSFLQNIYVCTNVYIMLLPVYCEQNDVFAFFS